ncbi:MAG: UvrD-helicase domain-containing protein, partial [Bacillota bacterium]|nr:UvrD-helicase domain-containing protein [Bacillota bacterium]
MSKHLADATARQSITTDLTTTFIVEAGAGSGKTTNLVQRMVSLVSTGTCRIEHLAAITFTRKAAAELKSRFQIKLEKALRVATDATEHERLAYTLDNLHLAFLGTIHSFCSRLLRERPVEAGMTPDFDEIEGLDERLLQERAWQEYLQKLRLENPKQLHDLADLDVRPEDLKAAYLELCLYPDVCMVGEVAPYPDLNEVREELFGLIDFAAPLMPADEPDKGWDALQAMVRKCRRWQRAFDLSEDKYLLRLLAQLDKKGSVTQNRWITKDGAKAAEQAFIEFREQHLQPALQQWREHRHYPLLAFLLPATEHYASLRQQEHKLNFQDLLMRTAALLRHNSEVRQYFGERFTHLLVDEFQDTDPIQAEIMMLLTAEELTQTEWSRTTPRPGSLFVVGDPKQ